MQLVDHQINALSSILRFLGYDADVHRAIKEDSQFGVIERDDVVIHMMRDSQSRGLICTLSTPYVFDPDLLYYDGLFTADSTQISELFPGFAFTAEPRNISGKIYFKFLAKTYLYYGAGEFPLPFQAVKDFAEYLCDDFVPTYLEVLKDITGADLKWSAPGPSASKTGLKLIETGWGLQSMGFATYPTPFELSSLESLRPELGSRLEIKAGEDKDHAKMSVDGTLIEVRKIASPREGFPILEGRSRLPLGFKITDDLPLGENVKAKIKQVRELALTSFVSENTSNMSIVRDPKSGEYEMVITTKFPVCDSFPEELHPQLVRDMVLNIVLWYDHTKKELGA